MQKPKAFIFDLNGTMVDDMKYHTKAWHDIINDELNTKMAWEEVGHQMYGKNEEVLIRIFGADRFSTEEMNSISADKESRYRREYLPYLSLLPGLDNFLKRAGKQNIKMAIGTAGIKPNIDFVLDNLSIRSYFKTIVSADDVRKSKPDPETFIKAAILLGIDPADCIVFEDAPKGVETALNANMRCVVITTMHPKEEFTKYPNVIATINDYTDPFCNDLLA